MDYRIINVCVHDLFACGYHTQSCLTYFQKLVVLFLCTIVSPFIFCCCYFFGAKLYTNELLVTYHNPNFWKFSTAIFVVLVTSS